MLKDEVKKTKTEAEIAEEISSDNPIPQNKKRAEEAKEKNKEIS